MSSKAPEIFVALGGNVGDVRAVFRTVIASDLPSRGVAVERVSSAYRTRALTVDPDETQHDYWNAVIGVATALGPEDLMRNLAEIEDRHGRLRERRWAPRTLDLDLLLHGSTESGGALEIPHPRLHERAFVLVPLLEVAPRVTVPGVGLATDALDRLGRAAESEILERDESFRHSLVKASI